MNDASKSGCYYYTAVGKASRWISPTAIGDFQRALDVKAISRIRSHHMRDLDIRYSLRHINERGSTSASPSQNGIAIIFHKRKKNAGLSFLEHSILPINLSWLCRECGHTVILQTDEEYYDCLVAKDPSISEKVYLDSNDWLGHGKGLMYDRVLSRLRIFEQDILLARIESFRLGPAPPLMFIDSDLFLNTERLMAAMSSFGEKSSCYLFYTSTDWQWGINEGLIAFSAPNKSQLLSIGKKFFSIIARVYESAASDPKLQAAWPNPYQWRCGQAILNALLPNNTVPHYGDVLDVDRLAIRLLPGHLYNHMYNPLYNDAYSGAVNHLASLHLTGDDKRSLLPFASKFVNHWGNI